MEGNCFQTHFPPKTLNNAINYIAREYQDMQLDALIRKGKMNTSQVNDDVRYAISVPELFLVMLLNQR